MEPGRQGGLLQDAYAYAWQAGSVSGLRSMAFRPPPAGIAFAPRGPITLQTLQTARRAVARETAGGRWTRCALAGSGSGRIVGMCLHVSPRRLISTSHPGADVSAPAVRPREMSRSSSLPHLLCSRGGFSKSFLPAEVCG